MNLPERFQNLFRPLLVGAIAFTLLFPNAAFAQGAKLVSQIATKKAFSLTNCSIVYDQTDAVVVCKTAALLSCDIAAVTGYRPSVIVAKPRGNVIILGTLGKNATINALVADGKLNVSAIKSGWDQFVIQRVFNPLPGVAQALVIAGSDRRGTAYGAFTLSKAIGVSPWEWWADVPVKKQRAAFVIADYISQPPSVKYRGIFINDEDWGLFPWASRNFEKDLHDIGPKTYAKVCELLLRLKGNMLAPAMHSCTGAFYSHEQSKVVADEFGIIISTSHCEPLLFNNAAKSEWDTKRDGDWDYGKNQSTILQKLDNRVKEAFPYENIYTVGLRGLHDEGMRGGYSRQEKVNIVDTAMADQRHILKKYINQPVDAIPQIYVPYKEALDVYNDGLRVPDDVTLVWTDDNYGYIKRLSNPEEQKRSGASGVYYHTSYLGAPHDNLWLCTTPPALMFEELKKAYNTGANRYWLLNVGDIKPAELAMQTYFDLAWDISGFDFKNINTHQSNFLANIFGTKFTKTLDDIVQNYYRLAWSRKPEFMGWEREWDALEYKELATTAFSFEHYNDAQQRIADYQRISDASAKILTEISPVYRPAFFELVAYPVWGAYQMNRKFLLAQLNQEMIRRKDYARANWAATQAKAAFDSINVLTEIYNTQLNGKWNYMMKLPPGWVAKYQNMPAVVYTEGQGEQTIDLLPKDNISLEGSMVINLKKFKNRVAVNGHTLRIIEGLGYDWNTIQLGEATEEASDPADINGSRFEYAFSGVDADTVNVHVYTLPVFPLYKGKGTSFGISVDGQSTYVADNKSAEFSKEWKNQVLQNGAVVKAAFAVDKNKKEHSITFICGDPGIVIQKVVLDWGGLKKTYIGPAASL